MNNNTFWVNRLITPYSIPYNPNINQIPSYDPYYTYFKTDPIQQTFQNMKKKFKRLQMQNQDLKKQLNSLKNKQGKGQRRRVLRRSQDQLQKNIQCPYENCRKQYASNLALNLHIRIKHNGGTKKEREEAAQEIIRAQMYGRNRPKLRINIAPKFLQQYRKQKQKQLVKVKSNDKEEINEDEAILSELETIK